MHYSYLTEEIECGAIVDSFTVIVLYVDYHVWSQSGNPGVVKLLVTTSLFRPQHLGHLGSFGWRSPKLSWWLWENARCWIMIILLINTLAVWLPTVRPKKLLIIESARPPELNKFILCVTRSAPQYNCWRHHQDPRSNVDKEYVPKFRIFIFIYVWYNLIVRNKN